MFKQYINLGLKNDVSLFDKDVFLSIMLRKLDFLLTYQYQQNY